MDMKNSLILRCERISLTGHYLPSMKNSVRKLLRYPNLPYYLVNDFTILASAEKYR